MENMSSMFWICSHPEINLKKTPKKTQEKWHFISNLVNKKECEESLFRATEDN